jgi:hypothetical protein
MMEAGKVPTKRTKTSPEGGPEKRRIESIWDEIEKGDWQKAQEEAQAMEDARAKWLKAQIDKSPSGIIC